MVKKLYHHCPCMKLVLYSLTILYALCLVSCEKDSPGQPSRNNASRLSDSARVNGKQTGQKTPSSDNTSTVRQYDYLKEYEALSRLSSGVPSQEGFVDANSEKELVCFAPSTDSVLKSPNSVALLSS